MMMVLFAIVIGVSIHSYLIYGSTFLESFLSEFMAGFTGIIFGFYVNRYKELEKKKRVQREVVSSILVELYHNFVLLKGFKIDIKVPKVHRLSRGSQSDQRIDIFDLFQTNAWDMFSTRLELDSMKLLFDIGRIYHNFELFNEGMKSAPEGDKVYSLLRRNPNFFEHLEEDTTLALERLELISQGKKAAS